MIDRRTVLLALGGLPLLSDEIKAASAEPATADDTARFLAGLPPAPASPLQRWTAEPAWRGHAAEFDRIWSRLEKAQLSRIRAWSETYLSQRRPVLLYMFSGPDFLYADAFFPDAETYVLCGLEPVGAIPQVTEANRRAIARIRGALSSVLNLSFFKTINMRSDFAGGTLGGVLPALYVFLARAGKTVEDATLVRLGPAGQIEPLSSLAGGSPMGVRIRFSDAERQGRTLYYFQVDVSNRGPHLASLEEFCRGLGSADAFIKSASFLMHTDAFSRIREFLLRQAHTIVQDDSGIPVRFFARSDWDLVPFGRYLGPIPLFANRYQRQLAELYSRGRAIPIDFGVGYRYRQNESNLLLALRKPQ
jgi:hypothetical protein